MTPAVARLERCGVAYQLLEYAPVDPAHRDLGVAAARALELPEASVFKTLVAELADGELIVAVIPAATRLNLKALARAAGAKSAALADPAKAERTTGYVTGGISPVGQKRPLRTFIDAAAKALPTIYVSAGRRGLELALATDDLIRVSSAAVCPLSA